MERMERMALEIYKNLFCPKWGSILCTNQLVYLINRLVIDPI